MNILLADIGIAVGGVENIVQAILGDARNRPDAKIATLVTPTQDNTSFIEYCRRHASICIEKSEIASMIFELGDITPHETALRAPHNIASASRRRLKPFLVKQAKKIVPAQWDRYWWHRSLIRNAAPLFVEGVTAFPPDILHCHAGTYKWFAPVVFARGKKRNPKIIFHLGSEPVLGDLSSEAVRLWRQADYMIYVSNPIKALWEKKYPRLAGMPNQVIHHGIELGSFPYKDRSARNYSGENPFRIGLCSRLSFAKGVDYAIRAFAQVHRQLPHAQLEIVGTGPEYEKMASLVHELELDGRVIFHGHQESVLPFLHQFDLFIQPSRNEAFGISNVEAMATGLPVIASRAGGIPDIVVHDVTGRLVEIGDIAGFAREIIDLHQNPELRHRYGLAGRQRAEALFSQRRMCDEIHEVYRQVLNA